MTPDINPMESLGPAPFRFTPTGQALRSRAFSLPFRLLASGMVLAATVWLAAIWRSQQIQGAPLVWFAAAVALMLYTLWHILTGVTTLDGEAVSQSWVWQKRMELRELAYCKLIRVRGLDWLIAPRLYARTLAGKFAVFYAADAAMIREFERLVKELAAFRQM